MPAVFVHDCIAGCPGMGPRPLMPIEGKPARKLGNIMKRSAMNKKNEDTEELEDVKEVLKKPPGPPKPGKVKLYKILLPAKKIHQDYTSTIEMRLL